MKIFETTPGDEIGKVLDKMAELSFRDREKYVVEFNGKVLVVDSWESRRKASAEYFKGSGPA